ncbi:hypothetical protein DBIPINDM_004670 [Mesorhizobium sp. AR02]|uniref:hypothetical protein n=1 Tax=Mesorhizobium sp. AR02 TaxID=2865837 RepID=UPI00215ECD18|nr:hypothetical protein [Mesorhizobium sp. AR02]UVK51406.1 hypothetical protein DBIPINDM_004670 [Mesorhizobium sp. AR02]
MFQLASNQMTGTALTVSLAMLGLLANTIVSEAAYSPAMPFVGVHSLRADNGDFDTWGGLDSQRSFAPKGMVDPIQTGSSDSTGGVSTSKCLGVSPRIYDPVSPNCRN